MNLLRPKEQLSAFPSNRIIRKMGYSNDQEGIMQRHINEEGGWNAHLQNSKKYIINTIEQKKPNSVAILGSGWLLDVPIEHLAKHCKKVYLYDIRHPRQIINRIKKYANVELINMDITGGLIQYVFRKINKKEYDSISDVPYLRFEPIKEVEYTVSLNLLNQLDILIVEYLRKFPRVKNEDINIIRQKIQLAHLKSLSQGRSCIISDVEEFQYDRTEKLVKTSSLIFHDFPKGENYEEWIWEFDKQMSYYNNRKTYFKVKAIQL